MDLDGDLQMSMSAACMATICCNLRCLVQFAKKLEQSKDHRDKAECTFDRNQQAIFRKLHHS